MPDLIPMLCSPIEVDSLRNYQGDEWEWSQKVDGRRVLTELIDGRVTPLNRSGGAADLPAMMSTVLARTLAGMPDLALDGELVGTRGNHELWLFDLPHLDGMIEPASPYHHRRAALEALHGITGDELDRFHIHLLPVARTLEDKLRLLRGVTESGAEGIVVKHLDHPYRPGDRSLQSLKAKFVKTIDCVVSALGIDGKRNLGLEVYDPDGTPVNVGEVSALTGDGARCKVGDIVAVTYLYATVDRKLYGPPTRPMLRHDKAAAECTSDQLSFTDRAIVAL